MTTHRVCGDCQLCCKLLPIKDGVTLRDGAQVVDINRVDKPAGERCPHQCRKGCRVYERRPWSCEMWNCRWLLDDDTGELPRPDRAHYVVDVMPDYITLRHNETGAIQHCPVIQVWLDGNYPDAHRDPALRSYLARQGELHRSPALIRRGSGDGFVLFPPSMSADGQWHEATSAIGEHEHTLDDKLRALGEVEIKFGATP